MTFRSLRVGFTLAVALLLARAVAAAANDPLELINIGPSDANGIPRNNRIYRAYPGLEYNIRAAVIGGSFPFQYTLSNAPLGMTIDPRTGEISWPDPRTSATPTIAVRDSAGAEVTATWTIDVSADGFRFIDATNGRHAQGNGCTSGCGTGTMSSPWRSLSDMQRSSTAPGDFVYFRNGTYRVTDLTRDARSVSGPWERVEFAEAKKPVVWLAYPGERPTLHFGYKPGVEAGPLVRFVGDNVYVDGFETTDSHIIGFQFASLRGRGPTFRRLRMHTHGPGMDGSNASMIMTMTAPVPANHMVVQDCEFYDAPTTVMMKIYKQQKMLIEDNVFRDALAGIELKGDIRQFTLRGNTFYNIARIAIGGNMHESTTSGEMLFNNVRSATVALDVNQDGMAGPIRFYRNTFVGRVEVRNTDHADGPFLFTENVIVNNDSGTPSKSRITQTNVTAPKRIVVSDNLTGRPSDNLVDASGSLTAAQARYIGTRGHQRR